MAQARREGTRRQVFGWLAASSRRASRNAVRQTTAFHTGRTMTGAISESETSRFAQAKNVQIHYNETGSGPPLICLHGGGPGATSWSNFTRNIDAFAKHYRVLLVDLPRFGKSQK